ncbi:hypothetical protein MK805_17010 [Shimazuella sp. AN120528]|uniref:hypothetical protein n=1 Tax=Shimazuella soli TaxID=1892854 RepID=UPI001F0F7930|nr:hypothetical protein [Shimazuella soli]MCH5586637.1 hypothetical protein [Shimazuella soli]
MLYLVYRFKPTAYARANLREFWKWMQDREAWFYDGLEMVLKTEWYVRTIGVDVHSVEHIVLFENEEAWGAYRDKVRQKSQDTNWEARRTEQEKWYDILDSSLLSDPPVQMGLDRRRS